MKKTIFVIGLIILSVLVAGCTSETKGNVSAPTGNQSNTTAGTQPQKDTYSIGETFKPTKALNGLEITLTKIARIENCTTDGDCTGVYVKVKNNSDKELEADFIAPVLLDDAGKQYEKIYTSFCPTKYETTLNKLYPGTIKEGVLCFPDLPKTVQTVKAILQIGMLNQVKVAYQASANQIKTATKKAELTIDDVETSYTPATDYSSGSGTLTKIKTTIKNTGETYLTNLKYDYSVKKGDQITADENDQSTMIYSIEPGKTEQTDFTEYKEVGTVGDYTIELVLKDKKGELARATKTFHVG